MTVTDPSPALPERAPSPPDMARIGWGDPHRRTGLPRHAAQWLAGRLGPTDPRPPDGAPARVPSSTLPEAARSALAATVGPSNVLTGDAERALRATGKSYLDLLAQRSGELEAAPDAVVLPADAAEVRSVLAVCAEHRVAVVPFGGGTSVVGGLRPEHGGQAAAVSLDLRRLDRLLAVDEVALTATFEPGVRGPAAEAMLNARGLTLGHFPQSYEHATLGGYAATRSAGQASTGYGRFDEMVVGLELQTPRGPLRLGRGAASAAGPSLLGLALGSEGTLGVITELTVRVRRAAPAARHEGVFFRTWADGCAAFRALEQAGVAPDVARLSDPDETAVSLALAGTGGAKGRAGRAVLAARGYRKGCLAILGWDGEEGATAVRRGAALGVLKAHGGLAVGRSVGERWRHGRFDGPYLRDDLMDAGVLVETLETSATWSRLEETWRAVREALTGALATGDVPPVVMCHVSHLYRHGASLYFTVLAPVDAADPAGQWQRAKAAAGDAIVASGATITHHHAVGADHTPWMADEVGALGLEVLRAVKATLDPTGILNPGKLIPPEPS